MARRDKEQVKKSILESARRLFARFGPKKTTLDEIAQEAGIGKATLYYYFRDKQEIFLKVIEEEAEELLRRMEQAVQEYENPELKLRALILAKASAFMELLNLRWLGEMPELFHWSELKKAHQKLTQREQKLVEQILKEGRERGFFSIEDPSLTAENLTRLFSALEQELAEQKPGEFKTRLEGILSLLLDGIRARGFEPSKA